MNRKEFLAWLDTVPEDEPIFCLRAKDDLSPWAVTQWIREAINMNVDKEKIDGVKGFLIEFREWRYANQDKCRLPD